MQDFVHLHVHTQYSLLDGQASVARLVDKAMKNGMKGIAVTDHGNMFGIKEFTNYVNKKNSGPKGEVKDLKKRIAGIEAGTIECEDKEAEIADCKAKIVEAESKLFKPIIGCEMYVARRTMDLREGKLDQSGYHLIVLAKNEKGYHNLIKLVSHAWTRGYYMRPRTDRSELEKYHEGLIVCSACLGGEIPKRITNDQFAEAEEAIQWYKNLFGDDFYLEMQRHKATVPRANHECYPMQVKVNKYLMEYAQKYNIKLICTNDVHFVDEENAEAHDRLICLSTGKDLDDPTRMLYTKQEWMKTREEMNELFADVPEALSNTLEILDKVEYYSIDHAPIMPTFAIPEDFGTEEEYRAKFTEKDLFDEFTQDEHGNVVLSEEDAKAKIKRLGGYDKLYRIKLEGDYLAKLAFDGAKRIYGEPLSEEVKERMNFELYIMKTMGFPGYFLIVQDFINAARKELGVSVGPGRGSAAGSAVAYCLGITKIDPIQYDLLFERFLNPERVSMPDFDVDFCQYNRDRVIEYVKATYGVDAVSQIATFGTLGAKAVVRDVARALSIPYGKADNLAKLIPQQPGKSITLKEALETISEFKEAVEKEEDYQELIRLAMPLEGMTRNLGMHAGGVLIAPGKLTDFCPLYNSDGKPENTVSEYDKKDVENVGLVKFDFLGLTTLSILKKAVEYIKKLHPDLPFELARIPIKDEETYQLFQDANTAAVFQFESEGMRTLLKQARPDRLEDLVALNALYRPGPMDLIPSFINRKFGREKVNYPDKRMEEVLEETYGIMVYQEQVMRVAQVIGGYTLGGADLLRRAMGKKNVEEMKRQRDVFIKGAGERGVTPETATEIFDLMEKFAGYGFNKSHAAAYSYVAYQTAYLKVHHTAAFMAANLCMVMDQNDKVCALIEDAKENGVAFLAPDVNESDWFFTVPDEGHIRYGLGAVKGVGEQVVEEIMRVRKEKGPFKDLFDFTARVKGMSARVLENLIKAGSFDSLDEDRGKLFGNIQHALNLGRAEQENDTQDSLFGDMEEEVERQVQWVDAPSWSDRERLVNEKKMLGFCFTGHLFDVYEREARHFTTTTLNQLKAGREKVRLCGVVTGLRAIQGKRGRMAAITITDKTAVMDVVVYSEIWDRIRGSFDVDDLVCVTGRVRYDEFSKRLGVTADEVWNLMELRRRVAQYLEVEVTKDNLPALEELKAVSDDLRIYQRVPVRFKITSDGKSEGALYATMKVSNEWVDSLRIAGYKPHFVY